MEIVFIFAKGHLGLVSGGLRLFIIAWFDKELDTSLQMITGHVVGGIQIFIVGDIYAVTLVIFIGN